MIDFLHWDHQALHCNSHCAERLPATAKDIAEGDVWWLDLTNPTPEEEARVFDQFLPIHPLTRDDISKPRREPEQGAHFPKVEEFPEYLFVIVNPLPTELVAAKDGDTKPLIPLETASGRLHRRSRPQLSAILTRNVLITHHYTPLECVKAVRAHMDRHGGASARGPDYLFHLVLDEMVDEYAPIVDRVASRLDRIEARVFRDPSRKVLSQMLRLKRLVSGMRKTLILEREVLARLMRAEFMLVVPEEIAYYRNVYDHLSRYSELIDSAREMVSDLMQSHLSAVSNRLNEVMKVLAMISTVVLPMTLIAGIYGMNFEHMPELHWDYGYPFALGLMGLTAIGALGLFRWKKWI